MAANIDINSVYKAVLVVLEQAKRGVIMPAQFNKIATQCQQEIFTEYFDELNLVLRQPKTGTAYADRLNMLDEKIQIFKRNVSITLASGQITVPGAVQELGSVIYGNREAQRIQISDVYTINASPLTSPSAYYPVYTYENQVIKLYPNNLTGDINLNYLEFPSDVSWGFKIDPELGNYVYNELDSKQFTLHKSDQPLLVSKILGYAGVMTKDQFAMSIATQKEQQITANSNK